MHFIDLSSDGGITLRLTSISYIYLGHCKIIIIQFISSFNSKSNRKKNIAQTLRKFCTCIFLFDPYSQPNQSPRCSFFVLKFRVCIIKLLFQSIIYHIWKERNMRIFQSHVTPAPTVRAAMDRQIRDRLLSIKPFHASSLLSCKSTSPSQGRLESPSLPVFSISLFLVWGCFVCLSHSNKLLNNM